MTNINVIYLNTSMSKIEPSASSNWVDLRSSETIKLKKGEEIKIPLGIKLELPDNYEAHIITRKMTFKKYGIIQSSGITVITSNDTDEISISVFATKDATINFNDRVCQMKVEKIDTDINYVIN